MSLEITVAPRPSQKRIDANRRNAQRSTGPRTPEGKCRSRFNRLQHGLAATVPVLPGEDHAAFQSRVDAVVESFAPQNQVEFDLLERVAASTWSFERATRAETARLCHNIRHDAIEREQREKEESVALGQRLLWDARGPWQVFPHGANTGLKWERRVSWSENPADPNNPALLVVRLERTVAGCRWLLDRWAELRARLEPPGGLWVASDQFKAIRLLGNQISRTEPNSDPDGTSGNGPGTRDHGQSTRVPRTEPNRIPRTEPNATRDAASDRGQGTNTELGKPDWPELRKVLMAQVTHRIDQLNQTRQQPPRAPAERTSRKNPARAGPRKGNKGRRK
jgi:hypothetical protein